MNKFKKRMRCGISLFGLWGCQKKTDVTTLLYVVPATPEEYVADCFLKGFLHFSDKGDYVLDELGLNIYSVGHLLALRKRSTIRVRMVCPMRNYPKINLLMGSRLSSALTPGRLILLLALLVFGSTAIFF